MSSLIENVRLPIVAGELRGGAWLVGSHGKLFRVLLANYEPEQTALFRRVLEPGQTVFDIGAHVGYYTVLASRLVGEAGRVVAFEPAPENARFLRRHVEINGCGNVTVVEAAVGNRRGTVRFDPGPGSGRGRISDEEKAGAVEVPALRLDDYAARTGYFPDFLKVDVEGAEVQVLRGAARLLRERRPRILLSVHGPGLRMRCAAILTAAGYRLSALGANEGELFCEPEGSEAVPCCRDCKSPLRRAESASGDSGNP